MYVSMPDDAHVFKQWHDGCY